MTAVLTVSIWRNVTRDAEGRRSGFGGFTPGDQMVKVFTYDTPAGGRRRRGRRRRDRPHRLPAGFAPLRGTCTPVRVHEHGTLPVG